MTSQFFTTLKAAYEASATTVLFARRRVSTLRARACAFGRFVAWLHLRIGERGHTSTRVQSYLQDLNEARVLLFGTRETARAQRPFA